MSTTTSANNLTLVHKDSSGMTQCFPDACKTPSPAGPVPIPYPNIAMSTDTADGTSTVKVDGNPVMMKSSNFSKSSGDEAGSAMGVVSNKNMGKAIPIMGSMDVKVDGECAHRLTDPMIQNNGANPNAAGGSTLQPPDPVVKPPDEACEATKKKKEKQNSEGTSWGKSGILDDHKPVIQAVATEQQVILYIRQTKSQCEKWIVAKHMPKPHSVLAATTIVDTADTEKWLARYFNRMSEAQLNRQPPVAPPMAQNRYYSRVADDYVGVVGRTAGQVGQPIRGFGKGQSGTSYKGKWITGDYDLFQVLSAGEQCKEVMQNRSRFARIQAEINRRLHWDAIQHGPQAQWNATREEIKEPLRLFNMRSVLKAALRGDKSKFKVQITHPKKRGEKARFLNTIDKGVTVVAGNGVTTLDEAQDVMDSLICQGCDK